MLIVGKDLNYAAKAGTANAALIPSELDAGSIGIYGIQQGEFVEKLIIQGATATGKIQASTFKGDKVRICEGQGGGKYKLSESFLLAGVTLITPNAYAARVEDKFYIGYNGTASTKLYLPDPIVLNSEATLRVRETNSANEEGPIIFYTVKAIPGDTQQALLTRLKAVIDAGTGSEGAILFDTLLSNTGTDYGLRLTAKDGKKYNVYIQGVLEDGDFKIVRGEPGSGTPEQLAIMEGHSDPYRGMLYSLSAIDRKVASSLGADAYDFYHIDAVNSLIPGGAGGAGLAGNATVQSSVKVTVAFEDGQGDTAGGNQTEWTEIMRDLLPDKFPTGTLVVDDTP